MRRDVERPPHYNSHPAGIECIDVVEHLPFNIGNAIKYLWRCDKKHADPTTDLEKAKWYIEREINRRRQLSESFHVEEHRLPGD